MKDFITRSIDVAKQQALLMAEYLENHPERLPRSYHQDSDSIITSDSKWWSVMEPMQQPLENRKEGAW